VTTFADRIRAGVLFAVTGAADGRPEWVRALELGDDAGFFGPDSAAWVVHGGMPTFVAGIRALLMQTLHPGAMAGVHDWSMYREDPLGRLSRTVRWLTTVTFSDTAGAVRACERVDRLHEHVVGRYSDARGVTRAYSAQDPELLAWVHAVFTDAFLRAQLLWGRPIPGGADAYVREWATAAELVGVVAPPRSASELAAVLEGFKRSGVLEAGDRVREAIRFLRSPGLRPAMMPVYRVLFAGAVASLEPDYRAMLGLRRPWWPAATATRVALWGMGRVLRGGSGSEVAARSRLARLGLG
jgi:uncharacterized protein (DUF2236 family)